MKSSFLTSILSGQNILSLWQQELGPDWKTVHNLYLHTIGNLTLTGYNSELSDRQFQEKRTMPGGFIDSPLRLNKSLKHIEHWNKDEIEKRAVTLAEQATKIWAIPHLAAEPTNNIHKSGQKTSLAEIIGPVEHPLAGFVPEGFKLIQSSEKRFYLFREINNTWIQYGNGKNPWFAISWSYAGDWVRDKHRKNERPLGIGGNKITKHIESEEQKKHILIEDVHEGEIYTLNDHPELQGPLLFRVSILKDDAIIHFPCDVLY